MIEVRGAIGMMEDALPSFGRACGAGDIQRAIVRLKGGSVGAGLLGLRGWQERNLAEIDFAPDGSQVGYSLNRAAVGAVCLRWLAEHEAAGWPPATLDRDQQLGAFVARLCEQITDARAAAHYAANPIQLPWHGEGVLNVCLE